MDGRRWMVGAVAGAALLVLPAYAQDEPMIEEEERTVIEEERTPALEPAPIEEQKEVTRVEVEEKEMKPARERHDMRGITVMLGGGVEGYTGDLSPQINPGPSWGASAQWKPTKLLGLELGYHGAVNEIDAGRGEGLGPGATDGADIVRNGGEFLASLGLSPTPLQPYVLAGVGVDNYTVRADVDGFSDDTSGHIPVGAGLRWYYRNFTADARFGYSVLFDQEFASNVSARDILIDSTSGGRYLGTLNLGATF